MLSRFARFFSVLIVLCAPCTAGAFSNSVNIPLHSWVYDAIETVTASGLVKTPVINTKPMSRIDAARIVNEASESFRRLEKGDRERKEYLGYVIGRLVREFSVEISMAAKKPEIYLPNKNYLKIDRFSLGGTYVEGQPSFENNEGDNYNEFYGFRSQFHFRGDLFGIVSFYLNPLFKYDQNRFIENNEDSELELRKGYVKFTFFNTEIEAGRDTLWWGPGFHGNLIMTDNATPFDLVKISSPEPFRLPWIFRSLGDMKLLVFVMRLEEDRHIPRAYIGGIRFDLASSKHFELGVSRVTMFGGDTRPGLQIEDAPRIFFAYQEGTRKIPDRLNMNHLMSIDLTFRINNVYRFFPVCENMTFYGELGWEDQTKGLPDQFAYVAGLTMNNIFLRGNTNLRIEVADNGTGWYGHSIYESGYTFKNRVIGHHMGTDGRDLFVRLTHTLYNTLLGITFDREFHGDAKRFTETKYEGGVDMTAFFGSGFDFFIRYEYEYIDNSGFVKDKNEENHFIETSLSYNF